MGDQRPGHSQSATMQTHLKPHAAVRALQPDRLSRPRQGPLSRHNPASVAALIGILQRGGLVATLLNTSPIREADTLLLIATL